MTTDTLVLLISWSLWLQTRYNTTNTNRFSIAIRFIIAFGIETKLSKNSSWCKKYVRLFLRVGRN